MTLVFRKAILVSAAAFLAAGTTAASAQAQNTPSSTPRGWNYEIKDGKRVPKANRVTNKDGSWREESRQGNCITIKERSPSGEYKETRRCD